MFETDPGEPLAARLLELHIELRALIAELQPEVVVVERVVRVLSGILDHRRFTGIFVVVIGSTALLATILHGFEGVIWAAAYRVLGALPDAKSAMLYSLSAITSYGHANLYLEPHWQLMGALEALNGMLLFGLTTAFLFAMIQEVWPMSLRVSRRGR